MYEMLKREKPDAACVIVPESFISNITVAVINLEYHVLLETLSIADTFRW